MPDLCALDVFAAAWAFARDHRGLIIGTIAPALLLLRVPAAAMWATRLLMPLIALSRFLPVDLQWYLLSRLWVKAILHMQRALEAPKPGGGGAGRGPG